MCVGRSFSKVVRFALGVPQVSISGPLLFALYLSTLTEEIRTVVTSEVRTVEYADDVNIWLRLQRNANNTSYDTTQAQIALLLYSEPILLLKYMREFVQSNLDFNHQIGMVSFTVSISL